jgi:aminodeoxychorismate synthase component I
MRLAYDQPVVNQKLQASRLMTPALSGLSLPLPSRCSCVLEQLPLRLPFWRYHGLHASRPYSFLLDSARDPQCLGRYSFMGADPFLVYRAWRQPGQPPAAGGWIQLSQLRSPEGQLLPQPVVTEYQADVFADLQRLLQAHRVGDSGGRPVPLLAGAVGYFGYEAGHLIEELPERAVDDLGLPTVYFAFYDGVLAHDHLAGRSFLSIAGRGSTEAAARQNAWRRRDDWLGRIAAAEASAPPEWTGPPPGQAAPPVEVRAHFDAGAYARLVETARQHILAGDVFEVCTSHRLESPFGGDPWDLYQELRRVNPAPFAAYLHFPEAHVLCSSPERFLRLGLDRAAESRPIKGTRPRGRTPAEDDRHFRELCRSSKDRAENMMIVDLVRNDFGRVCKLGTVHVPELMAVEKYATVFQMVSTIRGELEDGLGELHLVRACFPGGSMTGAPKIEAMKIIDRLEPVQRGIYAGAIGYLDFAGPLDLNIVIRTIVVKGGRALYNVGGAVTADSDPHEEYKETMVKAQALLTALANLERMKDEG